MGKSNKKTKNPQEPLIVIYDNNEMNDQNELPPILNPVLIRECDECNKVNENEFQGNENLGNKNQMIENERAKRIAKTFQALEIHEDNKTLGNYKVQKIEEPDFNSQSAAIASENENQMIENQGNENENQMIENEKNKRQSLYNVEQQSEDIMDFLAKPVEDIEKIIEMDDEQGTDEENQSTDDEQVEAMIEMLDPDLMSNVRLYQSEQLNQINQNPHHLSPQYSSQYSPFPQQRLNSKMLFDHKIVSPYLMGVFVNGQLDTNQCAMLKDRKSRRQLFYILN